MRFKRIRPKETHQNENPCKVCKVFQLMKQKVWKAFLTFRFWKTVPKEQILKPTKNRRQSTKNRGAKKYGLKNMKRLDSDSVGV